MSTGNLVSLAHFKHRSSSTLVISHLAKFVLSVLDSLSFPLVCVACEEDSLRLPLELLPGSGYCYMDGPKSDG